MLEISNVNQISEIIDKGIEAMREDGYKNYQLRFVRWERKKDYWIVGFHAKESSLETVGVVVKLDQRGYINLGLIYE